MSRLIYFIDQNYRLCLGLLELRFQRHNRIFTITFWQTNQKKIFYKTRQDTGSCGPPFRSYTIWYIMV